jgi:disulfide bond formation protein DsbB
MTHLIKNIINQLFTSHIWALGCLVAIGVFSLGFALISQYGFGLAPCLLCIYQRWPYGIIIIIGVLGLFFFRRHPKASAALMALSSFIFFIGMGIAFFHAGVEQKWWAGLQGCSTPDFLNGDLSIEELETLINAAPVVSCGDIPWSLFGLSMAAYNTILSLAYGVYSLIAAIMITRKTNGV